MAALNKEAYQFMNTLGLKYHLIKHNKIIISLEVNDEGVKETSEWIGFVQTMKIYIKRHFTSHS